ncbi:MAG: endoglucanase [Acidimicrobiaceae bacterium]|nr:endoglucanase [Acidimicrobiaceae bacterium]
MSGVTADYGRPPAGLGTTGATRRMITAAMVVALVVVGIAGLSLAGAQRVPHGSAPAPLSVRPEAGARTDSVAFLHRYLAANGRVVRSDQGGDTVSEGQGYAMLVAVATGQKRAFAAAWNWDRTHLQQADGLFAYHWRNGAVVDGQSASDADLDTAWALVLASQRFGIPAYGVEGQRVASAILDQESAVVAGRLELVAGPWARTNPSVVNPSYLAPQAMEALGRATGDPRWSQLASSTTALVTDVVAHSRGGLLPNWVDIAPDGSVQPVGSPSGTGPPTYGLDAQRAPVWLAASCTRADRTAAAGAWPTLGHAAQGGAAVSYTLSGRAVDRTVNPLGLVAAAAAARASGHAAEATSLLAQADQQSGKRHTYYGDAWTALGRILLDTNWLSPCPSSA